MGPPAVSLRRRGGGAPGAGLEVLGEGLHVVDELEVGGEGGGGAVALRRVVGEAGEAGGERGGGGERLIDGGQRVIEAGAEGRSEIARACEREGGADRGDAGAEIVDRRGEVGRTGIEMRGEVGELVGGEVAGAQI